MPGGGDPRESAAENKPPETSLGGSWVRVKRCGKSAPPGWQQAGHGKPHPEQDHVGTHAVSLDVAGAVLRRCPGRSLEAVGNSRIRRIVITLLKRDTEPGLQAI